MTAKRSDPDVSDNQTRDGPWRAAESPHLAFRNAPPTFQLASASGLHQRPLLFVHADAAGGKQKAKKQKREIRSHVMLHTNENKRRAGVHKHAEKKSWETATVAALRLTQQTIWGVGTGELDPFGTLPVKETPFYRSIVDFFFHDMPDQVPYADDNQVLADRQVSPSTCAGGFWRLARSEPVTFLAWMYYVARVYGTMQGGKVSTEIISWEQRAREIIKEWLACGSPTMSDPIACAVGTLALCANNEGFYEVADVHFSGLLTIIYARGGLDRFEPFTQRGLAWGEFQFRMRHMTIPVLYQELSPIDLEKWRESFPLELRHQATLRHHCGQLRLPSIGADLDLVLFYLQHLSIAQCPQWAAHMSRITMRHILYDSAYKLLVILVEFKESTDLSAAQRVRSAIAQASQLFLLAALSEMPLRKALYSILVERLKDTLSSFGAIDQWTQEAHLHGLVWVLFVGWVLACKCLDATASQSWFQERLTVIMWQLGLSLDDLEDTLSQFPLTGAFFRESKPWTIVLS